MAVAIKLPDMGTNVEECKLLTWRVQEGQRVKRGDVLADIETDKAVAELESTAEGVLLRQVVKAGVMAQMGEVLAYVGQPGESVPDHGSARHQRRCALSRRLPLHRCAAIRRARRGRTGFTDGSQSGDEDGC